MSDGQLVLGDGPEDLSPKFTFLRSPAFDALNMKVSFAPDAQYKLTHFFTTFNGSWDQNHVTFSPPQWARDLFLRHEFDEAGADHHVFGAVFGKDGQLTKQMEIGYQWSQGYTKRGVKASGWAAEPIWSSFNPTLGQTGPWNWWPVGGPGTRADLIYGAGLPWNHHVSFFAVWTEL